MPTSIASSKGSISACAKVSVSCHSQFGQRRWIVQMPSLVSCQASGYREMFATGG